MLGNRKSGLDGLRAFAITLIVASHCGFLGQGGVGNCFFFALSGFLLVKPFSQEYAFEFDSLHKIGRYYSGRIIRIIPPFWCSLWLATVFKQYYTLAEWDSYYNLILNMFFVKSMGHLWFLQQEMVFYLIYPLFAVIILGVWQLMKHSVLTPAQRYFAIAVLLVVVSRVYSKYWMSGFIHLCGNGKEQPFLLEHFMIGMATGFVYKGIVSKGFKLTIPVIRVVADGFVLLFLISCIMSSHEVLRRFNPSWDTLYVGWRYTLIFTICASIAILILLCFPNGFANKFLGNRCFAYIGRHSYIIYLIHWYFLDSFRQDNHVLFFGIVYLVSVSCAAMLRALVEVPCLIYAKDYSFQRVKDYFKNLKLDSY